MFYVDDMATASLDENELAGIIVPRQGVTRDKVTIFHFDRRAIEGIRHVGILQAR